MITLRLSDRRPEPEVIVVIERFAHATERGDQFRVGLLEMADIGVPEILKLVPHGRPNREFQAENATQHRRYQHDKRVVFFGKISQPVNDLGNAHPAHPILAGISITRRATLRQDPEYADRPGAAESERQRRDLAAPASPRKLFALATRTATQMAGTDLKRAGWVGIGRHGNADEMGLTGPN